MMPLLLSYCGRLRYIHALEVVPYGKSSVERARVKAARAAQRDDAADRANLRRAHRTAESVDNGGKDINTSGRPTGTSRAYALRRLRDAPISTRVSLPARSARTRAWSKPGFASARGRDSACRKFPATRRRQN
jgi:hypothetical protein